MLKNLVIVESPAKAKTIEKFLGSDYKVMSSYGHIRDLCKKNFSIEVDKNFTPIYEIPDDKKNLVAELKKAAKQAQTVWLASDEDREGEAIAWHLYEVLGLKAENTRRIVFHEITKNAILNAIKHPREIDLSLVDAQQARRVLDRIVGFELSPVLWKKIKPSLSAGRVQSVAVRLIVEREEEIKNFKPEPYVRVTGAFGVGKNKVRAELSRRLSDIEGARTFLNDCQNATFTVGDVQVRPVKKSPAPPFTTSTLQQEASRKLGFTVSQTMMVAQRLYESGHITYMRTDSLNLSSLAIGTISQEITNNIGAEYLKVRKYHTKSKGAQEAHEAIRPTYIEHRAIEGTSQEKRLYNLIWKRTIASQMADAEIEKTTVDINISSRQEHFTATGEVIKFDGFLNVYIEGNDDSDNGDGKVDGLLPKMATGDKVTLREITAAERLTQQPARYTEASLVKKLEELGIGRPSTYAPTISAIQQREYVEKGEREGEERTLKTLTLAKGNITEAEHVEIIGADKGKIMPTDIGIVVNRFLTEYFPNILDYNFTASIEEKFDLVAEGKMNWTDEMKEFYDGFHPGVVEALNMRLEHKVGERVLGKDPESGLPISVKIGRFGPLVQKGTNDGNEKPQFASLLKGQSVETITLEEALKLFAYPKNLGEYEDKTVSVAIGRFGPYVKHNNKFVSIPKGQNPASLTLDEAIELIEAKRQEDRNKIVKTFDEEPKMQILNGRYGVYIMYDGANYKLPKTVTEPASLTLDECMDIVKNQEVKPKRTSRRATTTRKK
jgi:DNA topoisomerase-1